MKQSFGMYIAKFETNGGSKVNDQKIFKGETIKRPGNPVKEGFTFEGWYIDDQTFNKLVIDYYTSSYDVWYINDQNFYKWDFDYYKPSSDISLYARWLGLDINPSFIDFGTKILGYEAIEPQEVLINYTDAELIEKLFITSDSDAFTVSPDIITDIWQGVIFTIDIAPNTGLSAGIYKAVISISNGSNIFVNIIPS
ncbi:MAG: InlB B-repeat-containing protein [Treponema sp.]|nr:InlB B-repeat-containing protein [Treponema sp.]